MTDYASLIDDEIKQRENAPLTVVGDIDANPDNAARAMSLSQATGIEPGIIHADLEGFERQHKATLSAQVVRNNPYLTDYVNRDPMASKVSNDDYGQLDAVSESVQKIGPSSGLGRVFEAFKEGFDLEGLQSEVARGVDYLPGENSYQKALAAVGLGPIIGAGLSVDVAGRLFNAATYALGEGGGVVARQLGANEAESNRLMRDLIQGIQVNLSGQHLFGPKAPPEIARMAKIVAKAEPYVFDGKEPPRFLDPEIDKLKYEQNQVDLKNLDAAIKEAQTSATKERSPEIFQSFIESHTDAKIGISGDAVAKLYGDKVPVLDDGLLGFVPRIAEQLESARITGADIEIPLADWIARVDPAVAKELRDDTRVRPGAITKVEKDALAEAKLPPPLPPETPHETLRDLAGLEPLLMVPERKLEVKRASMDSKYTGVMLEGEHGFEFIDEAGKVRGWMHITEHDGGKNLHVEYVGGVAGEGPQSYGPRLVRDLLRQIKEQFPNAETLGGYRVTGARDAVGKVAETAIKLDVSEGLTPQQYAGLQGIWFDINERTSARLPLPEALVGKERELTNLVTEELNRIVPKQVLHAPVLEAKFEGRNVQGFYQPFRNQYPIILWSLAGDNPRVTARHEGIHHLKQYGFFSLHEWDQLQKAAVDRGWFEKYSIDERYRGEREGAKVEEAVAEAFGEWDSGKLKVEGPLAEIFQKIKDFLDRIKYRIKEVLGRDLTPEEIFSMVEQGVVGSREGMAPQDPRFFKGSRQEKQLDLGQDLTRMEDRPPFSGFPGATKVELERYQKLIAKRLEEDTEHIQAKALADEKRRQTEEWKKNEAPIRAEVVAEYKNKPEVMADDFFRTSSLYGEKLESRPRLDADLLTEEQKKALPERFYKEDGIHPDDAAGLFGFPDGRSLVDSLIAFNLERVASALRPDEFARKQISAEVNRRMERLYGNLRENIMDEVKDRVASETQFDILHEEVLRLAKDANSEFTISKDDLKQWAKDDIQKQSLWSLSSDEFFSNAGKAGRLAENALLRDKPQDAFREKQRQLLNMLLAKEAIAVEKEYAKFERTAKRFSRREVSNFDAQTRDYIQSLLAEADIPGQRSMAELAEAIARHGMSLEEFTTAKTKEGWKVEIDPDLLSENPPKPLDKMSVGDFIDFKRSIDSLAKVGAAMEKILGGTKQVSFEAVKQEAVRNLETLPVRKAGSFNPIYAFDAPLRRIEGLVKEFDLGKELGPLFNNVIRPIMDSKFLKANEMEALSNRLKEIKGFGKDWMKSLKDKVQNDFLFDPHDGVMFEMDRSMMINIMMNFGNESNITKFVNGWVDKRLGNLSKSEFKMHATILESKLWDMFERNANKEDWQFVQKIWDVFADYKGRLAELEDRLGSVPTKWIEAKEIATKHGNFKGGYLPLIYDAQRSKIRELKEASKGDLFHTDFWNSNLPEGFSKERTRYTDYIKFDGTTDEIIARMEQMIHVITHKEAVMNAQRFINDGDINSAIRKHFGDEYSGQLNKWIQDVANSSNLDERALQAMTNVSRWARLNLVTSTLGFSLKVLESPSTGKLPPHKWLTSMVDPRVLNEAEKLSKEIPLTEKNLDRDLRESLDRSLGRAGVDSFRKQAIHWGFYFITQVEKRLRASTFMTEYKSARAEGIGEADAIARADSAVREYHGATGMADLPAILRTQSEGWRILTMFYGYLNTTYNITAKIPGNVRRGEWQKGLANAYAGVIVPSMFGALIYNQIKKDDNIFTFAARSLALGIAGMIPFGREAATYAAEGYLPGTAWGSILRAIGNSYSDVKKWWDRKPVEKPIAHVGTLIGNLTGIPGPQQASKTGQFIHDYQAGKQHPQNFMEWIRGINNGEARQKR